MCCCDAFNLRPERSATRKHCLCPCPHHSTHFILQFPRSQRLPDRRLPATRQFLTVGHVKMWHVPCAPCASHPILYDWLSSHRPQPYHLHSAVAFCSCKLNGEGGCAHVRCSQPQSIGTSDSALPKHVVCSAANSVPRPLSSRSALFGGSIENREGYRNKLVVQT